ncbi:MAG: SBBP repeat-containing protein [Deltaproteobacteria bacterium]|nr:SBBP repeat-containing protein [Deltaproteobacteria bacterium]
MRVWIICLLLILTAAMIGCSSTQNGKNENGTDEYDTEQTDNFNDSDSNTHSQNDTPTDSSVDSGDTSSDSNDVANPQRETVNSDWPATIATDSKGNIYVSGYSDFTWKGPHGESPLHEHSRILETEADCWWESGCEDAFILKLDAAGAYQWHTFFGHYNGGDFANHIHIDESGNPTIIGNSRRGWPGPDGEAPRHTFTDNSDYNSFLIRLDSNGAYQWHTFYPETAILADGDSKGNTFVLAYSNSAQPGPSNEAPIHSFPGPENGETNMVLTRYDSTGAYKWHSYFGGDSKEQVNAMNVDNNGNVSLSGFTVGPFKGPDNELPIREFTSVSGAEIFALKVTGDGDYLWHTFFGAGEDDTVVPRAMTVDKDGSVYLTGYESSRFAGADIGAPIEDEGYLFVIKLDEAGQYQWHTTCGPKSIQAEAKIAVDDSGNVYLTTIADKEWNGPGGQTSINPYSAGEDDMFNDDILIIRLDSTGHYQWHTFHGAIEHPEDSTGVDISPSGNIVIAGNTIYSTWTGPKGEQPLNPFSGFDDVHILSLAGTGDYQWHTFYGTSQYALYGK